LPNARVKQFADRRAYSPVLRQANLPTVTVPSWDNRQLRYEFAQTADLGLIRSVKIGAKDNVRGSQHGVAVLKSNPREGCALPNRLG
jgi:hypothetical protein